ncbi:Disease resistance protein RBA1 [Cardamine amara subsp. amara]|uniref:Disease resistance protein RBA1 n=1 Tax=Cardamine amara subsp. amara TaxID=228776 RepID=A0ABD1AZ80_CARAN
MAILSRPLQQVFINFRGKDVRYNFASHLTDALERNNIKFFIDTHEQKGRDLKYLFKRIEEATIVLVILSTRYTESKWCLEELATIIEQAKKREMIVIPIFYKVRPEDVRKQKGVFGQRFRRRTKESSREEIEKWQVALKAVSNKIGLTLDHHRSEAKFIKKIVAEVKKVLTTVQSDEAREEDVVKKVKIYNVPLNLRPWFGSAVGLISAVLGLVTENVQSDEGREDVVKKVKTYNVLLNLCPWFGSAVGLISAVLGLVTETVQSVEGTEDDCAKKVKTLNVPLVPLPWSLFGSAVELIGAVLGLLTKTVHKCTSPAKVILTGKAGSLVAISSRWADNSV